MRLCIALGALAACQAFAWHDPHVTITRAAISSLPAAFQEMLAGEGENIAQVYSFYPDRYRNAAPGERAFMQPYCELPGGRQIHNVTLDRNLDFQTVEYLFSRIVGSLRSGDTSAMARYAGTLAHLLEDSLSPAHTMDLRLLQDLIPPPAHARKLYIHAPMELSCPDFTLEGRRPGRVGATLAEAAAGVVNSCYGRIRRVRGTLIELIQAVYGSETAEMDRLRLLAARSAAELYADALYSILSIAREQSVAPPTSTLRPRLPAVASAAGVSVHVRAPQGAEENSRRAAVNLALGLREAVRALGINNFVQRTSLGYVRILVGESGNSACVEMQGDWPPHAGSQVTRLCPDTHGGISGVQTLTSGALDGPTRGSMGEWIRTVDHRGDPLFEVSVEPSLVSLRNHEKAVVPVKAADGNFALSVLLDTPQGKPLSVQVTELKNQSWLRVAVSGRSPEMIAISLE